MTASALPKTALNQLFHEARSHAYWRDEPVADTTLRELYELTRLAPTSVNSNPLRIWFLRTPQAKARLMPALAEGNRHKVAAAPVTAILAYDRRFHDYLPELFPHAEMRSRFVGDEPHREETAFRNGSLQGGYFILAARALGLDVGPLSGFDNDLVDSLFFAERHPHYRSNFICNLGHGDSLRLRPRGPRMTFEQTCALL